MQWEWLFRGIVASPKYPSLFTYFGQKKILLLPIAQMSVPPLLNKSLRVPPRTFIPCGPALQTLSPQDLRCLANPVPFRGFVKVYS